MSRADHDRIKLPDGWWDRFVELYQELGFKKLEDFCADTGHPKGSEPSLSPRTLYRARNSTNPKGQITADVFDILLVKLDLTTRLELIDALRPPSPATAPPAAIQKPTPLEEKIPESIQNLLDDADKLDREGKYAEALALIEQALKAAEECAHETAIIKATIDLAECITRTRIGLDRAESLLKPCLEKLPPGRDDKSRESALIYLGHIATAQGRVHEGKSLAVEAMESARSRNDRFTMARALIELGHAEEMLGNLPEALRVLGDAAEYFRAERRSGDVKNRVGAATNLAGCLATRAMVLEHQGNAPEMLTALTEAEQILREGDSLDNLGRTLLAKSRVLFSLSQFQLGVEAVKEAMEIFERLANSPWLPFLASSFWFMPPTGISLSLSRGNGLIAETFSFITLQRTCVANAG